MGSSEEVNNNFSPISQEAVENAKRYKADSYARCSGVDGIKQAIYNSNGALIALNVFGNYDTDERALIGLPGQFDKVKGRHCLFACGWDDDMEVETTHGTYKGFLILQESDRLNTSADGFRFLPYEAFTKYNNYGDRAFFEAWCTYESKLAEPNYHKDAAVSIPDVKRKHAYIQIGSRELKTDTKTIVMAVAPIVIDGTTLLPLRYLGEALGITVTWNAETKTVKAYDKEQGILRYFKVNTNTACDSKGNVVLTGIADTQIINGRTMLPVRLFAESFNCIVDYVKETKTIVISK